MSLTSSCTRAKPRFMATWPAGVETSRLKVKTWMTSQVRHTCSDCPDRWSVSVRSRTETQLHHFHGEETTNQSPSLHHPPPEAMSISSSSSLNATLLPPPPHPSNSSALLFIKCLEVTASNVLYTLYASINALLLPLYIIILHVGFQRWRRRQPASHSDAFTYHIILVELLGIFGSIIYTAGIFTRRAALLMLGLFPSNLSLLGQTLFHLLTCVERYLAVVHPITYMRLRERGGVRIRNISAACAWLVCLGWTGLTGLYLPYYPILPLFCMLGFSLFAIFVCCLSVLRALTHPGPGEVGRTNERVDQSKRRAFFVICAIMATLLLRFVMLLLASGLSALNSVSLVEFCLLFDSGDFCTLPSSLILPLLFLHKAGKLPSRGRNTG